MTTQIFRNRRENRETGKRVLYRVPTKSVVTDHDNNTVSLNLVRLPAVCGASIPIANGQWPTDRVGAFDFALAVATTLTAATVRNTIRAKA